MNDFHFFLRYGLTGVVLVTFFLIGLALYGLPATDPIAALHLQAFVTVFNVAGIANILAIGLFPTIGIAVQGCYIIWVALRKRLFTDEARRLVKARLKRALQHDLAEHSAEGKVLLSVTPDSAFVWAYYTDAPAHLIDWARRRRSYHYLGIEFAIAALCGELGGVAYPLGLGLPPHPPSAAITIAILAATALWVLAAHYLALLMKCNVDEMELVWAHARLTPGFRSEFGLHE
jgi:hypothetical protein